LIQQVPNRCIMCEKCVKTCHETIGSSALFVNEKGDKAFVDKDLDKCDFCGNCVQVCPTGTMISKPFKFKARPWELRKTQSVCTLCSAQCQVEMHSKQGKVMRVTSEDGVTVNGGNLCVGGFFGHDYLNSDQRLTAPLVAQQETSWEVALDKVVSELSSLREEQGGQAIAGLASPHLTNEENYLFQKLFRVALNSNNIDSEARFSSLRAAKVLKEQLKLNGASNPIDRIGAACSTVPAARRSWQEHWPNFWSTRGRQITITSTASLPTVMSWINTWPISTLTQLVRQVASNVLNWKTRPSISVRPLLSPSSSAGTSWLPH